ncbi:TonB-dependent receptor [Aliifodinibius salicampi]|uniref:TonB-dependent receptor n=1 Tax=Fodinibius salicampi TaxID=1920655 RepID=A0ABT3Q0Z7_9BACT|nr:carboxypeptidase-like regulatory domain-containing protein [Fodinibius salicampi]MCW9713779.1 TonB-dependent receptor [Fodinibius salicampi]
MQTGITFSRRALIIAIILFGLTELASAQFQYSNTPLLQIIEDIEQKTDFRFLYREALVSDINLSFSARSDNLFPRFRDLLHPQRLNLQIDSTRNQAIIFQLKNAGITSKKVSVQGQVVNASSGERLPFGVVTWQEGQITRGVSANESGSFTFSRSLERDSLEIRCSYVGYTSKTLTLDFSQSSAINELTCRLQPTRIEGNELIVTGTNVYSNIDRQVSDLLDMGTFSPMGESNTLRALQTLPSVSLAPALGSGLNVRGSPADGFQVLVDDITIYNQSHLFGLIDSFNSDVLQRSSFFYDIAPAQFQAPPGGTLSLYTKSGSTKEFSGSAGISNSAARISLEGPINKGNSSWLISGRTSYMNTLNWLNNDDLIEWGLNVDRNKEVLGDDLVNFESSLVRAGETDASFFDLHGKIHFEGTDGSRFIISGYFGGDNTRQEATRLYRSFSSSDGTDIENRPVSTTNDWQNGAGSIQYQQWLGENVYASSTIGASIYQTSFNKEDFTYITLNQSSGALQAFVFPYESQSVLNELKADQQFEFTYDPWLITGGGSYHYYMGEYFEDSFERPGYFTSQEAHQADAYAQLDYSGVRWLDIFGGARLHYYSNGEYLRWSPRTKLTLFPDSDLSVSGGFSRNHQFLNKISLSNTVTSDVWTLVDADHPPTSVNYYSGGIYYTPSDHFFVRAEAYHKKFDNIRLHEINTFSLSNTFNDNPWYNNNNGAGKGIEFLLQNRYRLIKLTQTFTISEMTLSNPQINEGEPFFADWDRTYRYNATLSFEPSRNISLFLSWMYATGTPNKLATFGPQNDQRLGDYQRADISAEYTHSFGERHLNLSFSVFNILDRQNPWYRELSFVIDQNTSQNRFRSVPVDVYDIGFQPSFNISVDF